MLKRADPSLEPEDEQPIGEVVSDLVEQGKAYAKAEVELAKAQALAKVAGLKVPAVLLFSALLFAQAAVTVLAITVALGLEPFIGIVGGGLIGVLLAGGAASLLAWLAVKRLQGAK
jgi:hypothetical protein